MPRTRITPLKRTTSKPLYRQLDEIMRSKIISGEWQPHDLIPSENKLAEVYGMSRMTARMVVSQLTQEGYCYRIQGKGTYVADHKITARSLSQVGIRSQMETMGYRTATRILRVQREEPSDKIMKQLGLDAKSRESVYVIERLRLLEGKPLSLHLAYIPASFCPGIEKHDLVQRQLCDILSQEYQLHRHHVIETLESVAASPEESQVLDVKVGFHLLLLKNFISTKDGRPFEYSKILFRGDKIKLTFEYDDTKQTQ
ncbi:MAG: GntR family transcriptional regulator [Thermoguttaceae bacterium]